MDEFLATARVRIEQWWPALVHWWRADRPGWLRRHPRQGPQRTYATVYATKSDDISSISGRVDTASDVEVVLVVPRAARWMRDPTVWPHIAAHVKRRGITLGVVTPHRGIRSYARENGLRAESSIKRLFRPTRYRVAVGEREFFIPRFPWGPVIRGGAFMGILAALLITACYAIPSAEVRVVPQSEPVTASQRVRLNPLIERADLERGVIPAQSVRRTIVTIVSTTTTGDTEVGDTPATVELEFNNQSEREVTIPQGTVVETDEGIGFATDAVLEVPPASAEVVKATALEKGERGNVDAETVRIADSLPTGVTVLNFEPATGGKDTLVPAVAAEDVDTVREIADVVLERVGRLEVEKAVADGFVFPETLSVAIFSEKPLLEIGEASEVFLMEYTAIISALVLTQRSADQFGELMLIDALPAGMALLPGTTAAAIEGEPATEGGTVSVQLKAVGRAADLFDRAEVSDAIVGQSPAEASDRLVEMLSLQTPPEIRLKPEFVPWRWLPRRADRITIVLTTPEPEGATGDARDGPPIQSTPSASRGST